MRRRGNNAVNRRKILRDELRDILETVAFHKDEQIIGAAHQKAGLDLFKTRDALGELTKTAVTLRSDFQFNYGMDFIHELFPI